jgi:ppGpp synthetase/RelA/SpoT-type nucleotidyltranferase
MRISRTAQTCRRRRWLVIVLVLSEIWVIPVACFNGVVPSVRHSSSSRTTVELNFRSSDHLLSLSTTNAPAFDAAAIMAHDFFAVETPRVLPIWLSLDRSQLYEENARNMTQFLQDSYFTSDEILQLRDTIQQASGGNRNMASGAMEFCLLLAETMEMGLQALTAGAIHYCSSARNVEEAVTGTASSRLLHPPEPHTSYAGGTSDIVADADRLKNLETIASSVIQEQGSRRASPNHRDAENVRHLLLTETKDWRALAIRTAACLFRLRGILASKQTALTKESVRTSREALSIYAPLASRLGMHRLKNELEGAAFKILYRRQYEAVYSLHQRRGGVSNNNIGESMLRVLEQVKSEMTTMLESDEEFQKQVEAFEVTARVKEPYSMWKKMLRLGYDHVLQVPDALAIRVVLKGKRLEPNEPTEVTRARERALCYYAQKLCQERWKPYAPNPRFKDYIGRPKKNGYQSLHYTAQTWWQGESWTLEVQVRSSEMHQVAEIGLASHWDYKATQKQKRKVLQSEQSSFEVTIQGTDTADHSSDAYLRKVQQWHWNRHGGMRTENTAEAVVISSDSRERADRIRARTDRLRPYLQAFSTTQSDLVRDHVFVFLTTSNSEGSKVLALPSGACVLDAMREVERTMGIPKLSAFSLNGLETSITKQLQNGDILKFQPSMAAAVAA